MPRRTAEVRDRDRQEYAEVPWPPEGSALVDAMIALHHPLRRRLFDVLLADGPAPVGRLARRTRTAPGSVSHHLGVLHRSGFVKPAPELARDTRESWWGAIRRPFSWSRDDFTPGTAGHQIATVLEDSNFAYQNAAVTSWMRNRDDYPQPWTGKGTVSNNIARATVAEMDDLVERLHQTLKQWIDEVRESAGSAPDEDRMAVRTIMHVFPSDTAGS